MSPALPNPTLGRRRLLRDGGLAVSFAALLAACGEDRGGSDDPGRVGNAPKPEGLPDGVVDDAALLRTGQSLEHAALDIYARFAELGALDGAQTELIDRFVSDHEEHLATLDDLIGQVGGEPFECANPFLTDRTIEPVLARIAESDDVQRDCLHFAFAFESMLAATYQDVVARLTDTSLRSDVMTLAASENRHAAAIGIVLTPDTYFSPAIAGETIAPDESGLPIRYAIPARFGQLGSIDLIVGARDEDGARLERPLQTPAANSYVYDYMSCDA